jgi:isoamylase
MAQYIFSEGEPYPLGATVLPAGVNFSIFTSNATSVELLLFERYDDEVPLQIIDLHPIKNRTFHYWHVFVEGIGEGQLYAYQIDGPFDPAAGYRFN